MRELTYLVAVSIDGRIAGPGGDLSAFPTGDHVAWQCATYPETIPAAHWASLGIREPAAPTFDTVIMGRRTYEVGLAEGIESPYPHMNQIVVSRTLAGRDLPVRIVSEDPVDTVRRLKRRPGAGIWLCGGGTLASQLLDEIDRLVIKLNPVLLGAGPQVFWETSALSLTRWHLESATSFSSGVVAVAYTRRPAAG